LIATELTRRSVSMYIVILGAGAMGCLFGGRLAEAGHRVVLVDVWPEHLDAINRDGLILETREGTRSISIPARRVEQVEEPPELMVLFTKSIHTAQALDSARHLLGSETRVLTLQNGLGNAEAVESFVSRDRIVVGMTTWPSDLVGPGRVRSLGEGMTKILSADARVTPNLKRISGALEQAGLRCEISPTVFVTIWEKLAFNAALNTLTAVTGMPVGVVGATDDGRELAYMIAKEVVAVANRKGVGASEATVLATVDEAFRDHGEHLPSMLQDLRAGRKTEIEAISGAVVREASPLGMTVPVTQCMYRLVRMLERGRHEKPGRGCLDPKRSISQAHGKEG
jgi:2-dehydropantoate 2-reductase